MSTLTNQKYNLKELVQLTKDIKWVSQTYTDGIKVSLMKSSHIVHTIEYIQGRIDQGFTHSTRQASYSYAEWIAILSLQLCARGEVYASVNLSLPDIITAVNNALNRPTQLSKSMTTNNIVKIKPAKEERKRWSVNGRFTTEQLAEIDKLAKEGNLRYQAMFEEAMTDYLAKQKGEAPAKNKPSSSQSVYLGVRYSNDEKRYAQVATIGIRFKDYSEATLMTQEQAETLTDILQSANPDAIFFITERAYVITNKDNLYMSHFDDFVGWTEVEKEADRFTDKEQAEKVIDGLRIIFNESNCFKVTQL